MQSEFNPRSHFLQAIKTHKLQDSQKAKSDTNYRITELKLKLKLIDLDNSETNIIETIKENSYHT